MKLDFQAQQKQQQRQSQKLALSQNFQQSLHVLSFSTEELIDYVSDKVLANPLVDLKYQEQLGTWGTLPERRSHQPATEVSANYEKRLSTASHGLSLQAYLAEQIHLHYRDTPLRQLVFVLADELDENGYLRRPLEDIVQTTSTDLVAALDALTLLQQLEPAGVGARSLQECLLLQIERREDAPNLLYLIVEEAFEAFALRKWPEITATLPVTEAELEEMVLFVQHLDAHPGAQFQQTPVIYVRPELRFVETETGWQVVYPQKGLQNIQIQTAVFERLRKGSDQEVRRYLEQQRKAVEQLRENLRLREATMVRIGEVLLSKQASFFATRGQRLAPLSLRDLAALLDLHESTISRAVKEKTVETPFGSFPLKAFFAKGFTKRNGGESVSVSEIKQKIVQLIEHENKQKPLSDEKIAAILLQTENLKISRRTIAKYRDSLKISASSIRKC